VLSNSVYTFSRFFSFLHPESNDEHEDEELEEEEEQQQQQDRLTSVGGRLGLTSVDRGPPLTPLQQKDVAELKKLRGQLERISQVQLERISQVKLLIAISLTKGVHVLAATCSLVLVGLATCIHTFSPKTNSFFFFSFSFSLALSLPPPPFRTLA
jgi:hypothetical protein